MSNIRMEIGRVVRPEWPDMTLEGLTVKLLFTCEAVYTVPVRLITNGNDNASVANKLATSNCDHFHHLWRVETSSVVAWHGTCVKTQPALSFELGRIAHKLFETRYIHTAKHVEGSP